MGLQGELGEVTVDDVGVVHVPVDQDRRCVIGGDVGESTVGVVVLDGAVQHRPVGDRTIIVVGRVRRGGGVLSGGCVLVIPRLVHVQRVGDRHVGLGARGRAE